MNTHQKRQQFAKDLDKLVSGDYVLVPKNPSFEMLVNGLAVIATGVGKTDIELELRKIWEKMIDASHEKIADEKVFNLFVPVVPLDTQENPS